MGNHLNCCEITEEHGNMDLYHGNNIDGEQLVQG